MTKMILSEQAGVRREMLCAIPSWIWRGHLLSGRVPGRDRLFGARFRLRCLGEAFGVIAVSRTVFGRV
jgi:hypothetical protein